MRKGRKYRPSPKSIKLKTMEDNGLKKLTHYRAATQALEYMQDNAWARGDTPVTLSQFKHMRQTSEIIYASEEQLQQKDYEEVAAKPGDVINEATPGYSGLLPGPGIAQLKNTARKNRRDPQRIVDLVERLVGKKGWGRQLTSAEVVTLWPEVAGEQIANNTQAESFRDGVLTVRARSTAWAQTLRYSIPDIMRICDDVMPVKVEKLVIKGPKAPSWKHGPRSVPGRGPRDTYG